MDTDIRQIEASGKLEAYHAAKLALDEVKRAYEELSKRSVFKEQIVDQNSRGNAVTLDVFAQHMDLIVQDLDAAARAQGIDPDNYLMQMPIPKEIMDAIEGRNPEDPYIPKGKDREKPNKTEFINPLLKYTTPEAHQKRLEFPWKTGLNW